MPVAVESGVPCAQLFCSSAAVVAVRPELTPPGTPSSTAKDYIIWFACVLHTSTAVWLQAIFEEDDRVLFISLHQAGNYPVASGELLTLTSMLAMLFVYPTPGVLLTDFCATGWASG